MRTLARKKGINLENLSRDLGRETIAREDVLQTAKPAEVVAKPSYWDVDHSQFGPVSEQAMSRYCQIKLG